jgi:hypothetical protein
VSPAQDIRDIRPLILIPGWWQWLAVALAAGAVLAALTVGYRLWRRRSARAPTPEEQARRALTKAEALAREGRSREWADVVAGTLRTALSARLGHDACPQTTSELAPPPGPKPTARQSTRRACWSSSRRATSRGSRWRASTRSRSSLRRRLRASGSRVSSLHPPLRLLPR